MSTKALANEFFLSSGLPLIPLYYFTDKFKYEVPTSNKGVRINGTLYKTTQKVKNAAKLNSALHASAMAFRKEKVELLKDVESINDANTANVSIMFEQLGNGLITYFIDTVTYFSAMPISDESMSMIIGHSRMFISNTYNNFISLKSNYDSDVSAVRRNTSIRNNNYNTQTQAQIDAAPQFNIFIGNSYTGMFGIERVFGTMISTSSFSQGSAYIAMADNMAKAKSEGKRDLAALKKNALYNADSISAELMKSFRKGLESIVSNRIGDIFDSDAFMYTGLENRPYDEKLWRAEIKNVTRDDWPKLKYLFDYYNINCDDVIQAPLFDNLYSLYGNNGDFDGYGGDELALYLLLTGNTTLKQDPAFQTYLKNRIIREIDEEFDKLDINAAGKTNELFSDVYTGIDNNPYLDAERISTIKQHISVKRAKLIASRGY